MADKVPSTILSEGRFRIGVDVGGTNTDAAIVAYHEGSPSEGSARAKNFQVVASSKSETTADVTTGICSVIRSVLDKARVPPASILSINIGTTHFVNAVVQCDVTKLRRVAVLRLCGPFGREVPPFADWPPALRAVLEGPVKHLSGGLELDGRSIGEISKEEVLQSAKAIKEQKITAAVVIGVFTTLDSALPTQEEYVRQLLLEQIPDLDVVCSREVGNSPFIERENAAILNASILDFGRKTIHRFEDAFRALNLDCALYLTQNDGTVLETEAAMRVPIKTFSSGATGQTPQNSLTGAMFLSGIHGENAAVDPKAAQVIMVDIGGTTTDFAALAPSGFPRQSPVTVKVAGVRTAFSLPELVSIGLGGGSHVVQHDDGRVTVGPTSVGYQLPVLSRCFGGDILTATDIVVASGTSDEITGTSSVEAPPDVIRKARRSIKRQLERNIDGMKVSDQDVVLLLVGGGSIIQMDEIEGVKACIRPPFYSVANAVGGEVDQIEIPGDRKQEDIVEAMKARAIEAACFNGAVRETVKIAEVDCIPVQYATNAAFRIVVRVCGDLGWERMAPRKPVNETKKRKDGSTSIEQLTDAELVDMDIVDDETDFSTYVPEVSKDTGEWFLSKIDLAFIAEGCGVLGTGGGGTVYATYLHSVDVLQKLPKGRMRVIDPSAIDDKTPTVSDERLGGDSEFLSACEKLVRYLQIGSFSAIASGEIGGANGMCPFPVAAAMDLPVLDADAIGRAFPKVDMCLPYVYGAEKPYPAVVADPRGNSSIVAEVDSPTRLERLLRGLSVELGLSCAFALSMVAANFKKYSCHHTVSECWYIGRAIFVARQRKQDIMQSLAETIPGCRVIFSGRIINVSREELGGWTIGNVTLETASEDEDDGGNDGTEVRGGPMVIQYQNEYLYAALQSLDGTKRTICTTPDLITLLDKAGTAVGTHELRYGLLVTVIAMPAHPLWITQQGMKASDPASFGLSTVWFDLGQLVFPN
ncbi:putative hydantoinase/oxoprolinase [Thozetella sp. PMI_491]|nr:putative hydantoinase/oxoprolinase [Thozetella sp. PMI_491]